MKIFLSAVSKQFKACRDSLASDLRAVGATVKVQEDFTQHDGTLLEKLEKYIAGCDRVVALVGDAFGVDPPPAAMPAAGPRRSYTQWEYFFALGERLNGVRTERKGLYVYFATAEFLAQYPVPQLSEEARLQDEFVAAIRASGEDRGNFASLHELRATVLRDGFRLPADRAPPQNLPYASIGALFKGREQFLAELRRTLQRAAIGRATAIVGKAVHGLGGVGKTRLAVEYAWQHADDYSALLFVVADSPENLRRNLAALVGSMVLNLPEQSATEEEVRVAAALRWLAEHPGWLLILDNVDTPQAAAAAETLLARLTGGHVLITSRLSNWSAAVQSVALDVLDQDDAAAFLIARTEGRRRATANDPADAVALAKEMDGLALALEQAGAYIGQRRCSLAQYLEEWRAHERSVQEWFNPQLMQYPRSVAVTWDTTLQQLGVGEITLLRLCAWLAPDPIPTFLLEGAAPAEVWRHGSALLAAEMGATVQALGRLGDALTTLVAFSMCRIDADGQSFSVHRVVQDILRQRIPQANRRGWIELTLRWVDGAVIGNPQDIRSWPRWNPLAPHLAAGIVHADHERITDPTARLNNKLATFLFQKALYAQAEPLMRRALVLFEIIYQSDHKEVATSLNNLASLLQATNRLLEAEPLMRRALAIFERTFGSSHTSVAINLNNLAELLRTTNRLGEAEALSRRALAIFESNYGPDHPDVATNLNNLAIILQTVDRLGEAEPLIRRALTIDEGSCGPDHPKVATRLNNLAHLLQVTNRVAEAEPLMRRALAIDERSYGPDHPNVAIRLNNLAALLRATNRVAEAEPLMWHALAIDERSYGPDHPSVATRLNNLALLLESTSRGTEAEPLVRRALAIYERSYGADHPEVAAALNNLSSLLRSTERLEEAEPLMRRALAIFEKGYGSNHPSVAHCLSNLASLLRATSRSQQAEPLLRQALAIVDGRYGSDHPSVAIHLNNLASLLEDTNRHREAEPLMRRALAIDEHCYDPDHPNIAIRLNNLSSLLHAANELEEAEQLSRRHLVIFMRFTVRAGHEHPHLGLAVENYCRILKTSGLGAVAIEQRLAAVRAEAGLG